jgi:hypothetical protein
MIKMAKAKTEKLSFSKFFPQSTAYVSVTGDATSPEDFSVNVKIGDGNESVSLFTSDWFKDDGLATLKAIQEGVQKAIDFHQKALSLPKIEVPEVWSMWDNAPTKAKPVKRVLKSTETVVKKKAAPKKK